MNLRAGKNIRIFLIISPQSFFQALIYILIQTPSLTGPYNTLLKSGHLENSWAIKLHHRKRSPHQKCLKFVPFNPITYGGSDQR